MAVVVYTNPATGKNAWDVPGWCGWYPSVLTTYLDACQPPTPAQIAETTLSNMGAAAATNPTVAAQIQTIASASPTSPQYCQADPQGCADYANWLANPTLATLIGPGAAGAFSTVSDIFNPSNPSSPLNIGNLLLIGGGVLVLLVLLRR